jgi:hypothetical protein
VGNVRNNRPDLIEPVADEDEVLPLSLDDATARGPRP